MTTQALARLILVVSGAFNTLVGIAQLFAPRWFFDYIGNFPPFNRHYTGDLGAFTLPLGIGLLVAARNPSQHASLIGVVALGSLLHALNHIYDSLSESLAPTLWLSTNVPLLLLALLLMWVWRMNKAS